MAARPPTPVARRTMAYRAEARGVTVEAEIVRLATEEASGRKWPRWWSTELAVAPTRQTSAAAAVARRLVPVLAEFRKALVDMFAAELESRAEDLAPMNEELEALEQSVRHVDEVDTAAGFYAAFYGENMRTAIVRAMCACDASLRPKASRVAPSLRDLALAALSRGIMPERAGVDVGTMTYAAVVVASKRGMRLSFQRLEKSGVRLVPYERDE